jgi:hypothetical protein
MKATLLVIISLTAMPTFAQPVSQTPDFAAAQCKAMARADFTDIPDAPTELTEAKVVAANSGIPAYCQLQGYVAPQIGIEVRLPISDWNGKFVEVGCGGLCGTMYAGSCDGPIRRGYACVASDMGHRGAGGLWVYNNVQAQIDFGYRATHVAALAGKAITERYYTKPPQLSYYVGCSTGGRQGMVEVQRFPWDFNGVIAGAPVLTHTGGGLSFLWKYLVLTDKDGNPLLSTADSQLAHDAAVAKCDLDDGLKDGIIGDPRSCKFDPAVLTCRAEKQAGCLSATQVAAMKKVYSGPTASKDSRSFTGGAMPGSELSMGGPVVAGYRKFASDIVRYTMFMPIPSPSWQITDFDFERDYKRFGLLESLYGALNPDLRNFKAAGGKLILYQGWSDGAPLPLNSIDYYETAEKTMGGRAATQDFFRLFMIPGMDHCTGGDGAFAIDYLSYLEAWVEKGQAPDAMIGAHLTSNTYADRDRFPLDPAKVSFTRPVYPYPIRAKYKGSGDPNQAASFGPVKP